MRIAMLVLSACWTGGEPPATETIANTTTKPEPPRRAFEIKIERTECLGFCPTYEVAIRSNGDVEWNGVSHVKAIGQRRGHASRADLAHLERMVDASRFFDLDDYGQLPVKTECVTTGTTTTCSIGAGFSICSDTSHTIITVRRGNETHTVNDAHCADDSTKLDELEHLVDTIANTRDWIGR